MNAPRVCVVCHEPKDCEKYFADTGWCCKRCLLTADRIHTVYRINGFRFVEILKSSPKTKTAAPARTTAFK